jgi:hypothetical protein
MKIQGAEAHTAQGTNQIHLTLEHFSVSPGLASTAAAELQLNFGVVYAGGLQQSPWSVPVDQIRILTAAVRAQTPQQFY